MSSQQSSWLPLPGGASHPAVLGRRLEDGAMLALGGLIATGLALAIVIALPHPKIPLVAAVMVGAIGVVFLMFNPRLEISVTLLVVYLGCLNGPMKLIIRAGVFSSGFQDVVMLSICIGLLLRLAVSRGPARIPPLAGGVFGFILIVLIEAFNPKTAGILKALGGFRQQLQWVPFFFFGYLLMRSTDRFRKAFTLLGVIALLNAGVATVQTQMSPGQLATWGPGYQALASHNSYKGGETAHVRPFGLGGDSGFGGGVAVITIAGTLALLTIMRKRRWTAGILCFGAIAAAATSLGRLQFVGTAIAAVTFSLLAARFSGTLGKPIKVVLAVILIAIPVGIVFVSAVGGDVFARYASLGSPESAASSATGYKSSSIKQVPHELEVAPFGFGLGTAGSVSSFGGKVEDLLEGHNVTSETQPNFLVKELGILGLVAWYGLLLYVILLGVRRIGEIRDPDLQTCIIAMTAPLVALLAMSYDGPVSASGTVGSFFWFSTGAAGYWLVGPGRAIARAGGSNGFLAATPRPAEAL
jgi:hypothetical protein